MQSHNACGLCRVEIDHLTVKSGKDVLIQDINMIFHCGELTALIGKNGAGKTTLIKAILGQRPHTGSITFVGHNETKAKQPLIGYVPQQLDFDKSSPVSVADFCLAAIRRRPAWLGFSKKDLSQLKDRLAALKVEHRLFSRLGDLSGGELQKVLLAAALEPLPDLLILDEPVSGVDAMGLELFYQTVCRLRDEHHIAILLVSHDLDLIRQYADRVVLIDKTILTQGSIDDVFESAAFQNAFGYLPRERSRQP